MHIIQIKVDGTTTGYIGPFATEEEADAYVRAVLEPAWLGATFHLTSVRSPDGMARSVLRSQATKRCL